METIFLVCAVVGGTLLVCQSAMTLLGLSGHGTDFGHDGGDVAHHFGGHEGHAATGHGHQVQHHYETASWLFKVVTIRTVIAALTFFGLAGMAALRGGLSQSSTLVIAVSSGTAAMLGVHALMQSLHKLKADGTVRIERAVGVRGTVYLSIPAAHGGKGKVHLKLQNRLVELQAVTSAKEQLSQGSQIVVIDVLGPDTVEVEPLLVPVDPKASSSHV